LAGDGGEVDPDLFALERAVVGELDDVEEAELEGAAFAVEAEGFAGGGALPEGFVDEEAVAVEAAEGLDLALGEVGEEGFVEGAGGVAAVGRAGRPADDVVLGVGREGGDDAVDVVGGFVAEVLVELAVHFGGGHGHGRILRFISRHPNIVLLL
jgi:hypothetical protein